MAPSPRTHDDTVDRHEAEVNEPNGYIPVRITEEPRRDGRVLVSLPDGTGLLVHRRNVVTHSGP
jgi:hypothetical protein